MKVKKVMAFSLKDAAVVLWHLRNYKNQHKGVIGPNGNRLLKELEAISNHLPSPFGD